MDAQFRKLIGGQRGRSENNITKTTNTDVLTAAQNVTSRLSVSSRLSLNVKTQRYSMPPSAHMDSMKAFSYDCVKAGKAPLIGGLPKKGNGPVKLATSRRAETGELCITNETPDKTIQNIRGGEYVVGMKTRPLSVAHAISAENSSSKSSQVQSKLDRSTSTAQVPQLDPPEVCISQFYPSSSRNASLVPTDMSTTPADALGLGLSTATKLLEELRTARSSTSLARAGSHSAPSVESMPQDTSSTTLQALRKAEYGRLVAIYGQEDTDRSIARLEQTRSSTSKSPSLQSYSPLVFDPLPQPYGEPPSLNSRMSTTSVSESGATWSDVSSQRHSALSFYSESSVTARSSMVEDDALIARDEVHKLVTQMRSTYLTAIESVTPSANKILKSRRRRKSSRKSTRSSKSSSTPQTQKADPTQLRIADMRRWSWPTELALDNTESRRRARSVHADSPGTPDRAKIQQKLDKHTARPSFSRGDSTTLGAALHLLRSDQAIASAGDLSIVQSIGGGRINDNVEPFRHDTLSICQRSISIL